MNNENTDFKTDFLTWSEFRQRNFITLILLTNTDTVDSHDAVTALLPCLADCPESVLAYFIQIIFSQFSTYESILLPYIHDTQNPDSVRLFMIMQLVLPHQLNEPTIDSLVRLYFNPHDTAMAPVIEAFVNEYPELTLPSLIKHTLIPHTAIRSQALLQIIGQRKIKSILGDLSQFPAPVIHSIKQVPLDPRPPMTPKS